MRFQGFSAAYLNWQLLMAKNRNNHTKRKKFTPLAKFTPLCGTSTCDLADRKTELPRNSSRGNLQFQTSTDFDWLRGSSRKFDLLRLIYKKKYTARCGGVFLRLFLVWLRRGFHFGQFRVAALLLESPAEIIVTAVHSAGTAAAGHIVVPVGGFNDVSADVAPDRISDDPVHSPIPI